ncbi:hypothetical protein AMAG_19718 [Allomyces macrogynus ATCC 38327]|uniref:Uncharacterized protein n=1 Tax=Allomyces macrogynus (strain ATCC 38327) TaxID=578462 RepID=A0A0L0SZD2_ALLM3|nr:hypothetical protein AMAG_19718 [Allomyces macrogynus ATCC 38327]|eukprot:KNE67862.1 hypothetical protein AMAG_19718 [Allomyces macrogynus ATCC 38327]
MDGPVRFLDFASPPPAMVLLAPPSPPLATLPGDACPDAHDPANFGISLFLLVGIVLSYVPQQLKIVELRSSEGLSPYFLLLGSVSCISTVANVALLQHDVLKCCDVWSPLTCFENALGLIQVASQAVMFLLILVLFLIYYPVRFKRILRITGIVTGVSTETTPLLADVAATTTTTITAHAHVPSRRPNTVTYTTCERCSVPAPAWRTSQMIGAGVTLYFIAVLGLWMALDIYSTIAPPTAYRVAVQTAAACFGAIATGMSCLQFLPQIYQTYRTKTPGALSILTMMMQTPGTLLLIYSLAARPGTNISTYLSYVVAATCQGSLLVMSLIYARRARRRVAAQADESDLFVATSPGTEFAQLLLPNASEMLYDPDDTSGLSSPSEAGVPTGTAGGNGMPARHAASWTSSSDAGALDETASLLVEDAGTVAPSLIGIASVETGARATSPVVPGTSLRSLRSPRLVASPHVGSMAAVKSLILEKLTESASTIDHVPPVPTGGNSSAVELDADAAAAPSGVSGIIDADAQSQAEPFLLDFDHGTTSPVPPANGDDSIAHHDTLSANGTHASSHAGVAADSAASAPATVDTAHASTTTHDTTQVDEAVQVPAPPAHQGTVVPDPASPILAAASPILTAASPTLGAAASPTPHAELLPTATLDTGARPQSAATVIYSPDPAAAAAAQPAQFVLPGADSVDLVHAADAETHGAQVVAQTGFTITDAAQPTTVPMVGHAGLVSPPALATSGDAAVHLAQVARADLVAPAVLAPEQLALSVAAGAIAGAIAGAVAHGLPLVTTDAGKTTTVVHLAQGAPTSGPVVRNGQVSSETSASSAISSGQSATVRTSTHTEHYSSSVTHTSSSSASTTNVHHHHTHSSTTVEGSGAATRTESVASSSPASGTTIVHPTQGMTTWTENVGASASTSGTFTSGTTASHGHTSTNVDAVPLVPPVIPAGSSASVQIVHDATTTQADSVSAAVVAPAPEPAHVDAVVPAYELPHDDVVHVMPAVTVAVPLAAHPEPDSTVFATVSSPAIRQPVEPVMDEPLPQALPIVLPEPVLQALPADLPEPVPQALPAALPAPVPAPTLSEATQESTQIELAQASTLTETSHADLDPAHDGPSISSPLDAPTPTAASLADGLDVATPTASRTNIAHHRSQLSLELPAAELADALDTPFWDADAPTSPLIDTHPATSPARSDPGRVASTTWLSTSQASSVRQSTTVTSHASSSTTTSASGSASGAVASTPISVVGFRVPSPERQDLPRPASPVVATTVIIDADALTLPAADAPFDEAADVSHGEVADPGAVQVEDVGQELLAEEVVDVSEVESVEFVAESVDEPHVDNDDAASLNSHGAQPTAEELAEGPHDQEAESIASLAGVADHDAVQDQIIADLRGEAAELEPQLDEAADAAQVEELADLQVDEAGLGESTDALLDEDADREPLAKAAVSEPQGEPDEAAGTFRDDVSAHDASDTSLSEDIKPETLFQEPADVKYDVSTEAVDLPEEEPDQAAYVTINEVTETETLANHAVAASLGDGAEPESETLFHEVTDASPEDEAGDPSLGEEDAGSDAPQGEDSPSAAVFAEDVDADVRFGDDVEASERLQDESTVLETMHDEIADALQYDEAASASLSESGEGAKGLSDDRADPDPLQDDHVEQDRADTPLDKDAEQDTSIDEDHGDEAVLDAAVDAPLGQDSDLDAVHEGNTEVIYDSHVETADETHSEMVETRATFEESADVTQHEDAELDVPSGEAVKASFAEEQDAVVEDAADEAADTLLEEAADTLYIETAELAAPSSEIADSDAAFDQADELVEAHETTVFHSDVGKQEVMHNEFTQEEALIDEASHQDAHQDADLDGSADAVNDAFATPIEAELEPNRGDDVSVVHAGKPALTGSTDVLFADATDFAATEVEPVQVALVPGLDTGAAIINVQPIKGDLSGDDVEFSAPASPPRLAEFDVYVPVPALVAADADAASVQSAETDRVTPVPTTAVVAIESDAASVQSFGSDGSTPVPEPTREPLAQDEAASKTSEAVDAEESAPVPEIDESMPATEVDASATAAVDAAQGSLSETETTEVQLSEEALNDHVLLEPVSVDTVEVHDATSASTESSTTKADAADDAEMQSPTEPCTRDEDHDADLPVLGTNDALDATATSGVHASVGVNQSAPTLTVIDQVEVSSGSFHAEEADQDVGLSTEASFHVVPERPSTEALDHGSPIPEALSTVSAVDSVASSAASMVSTTSASISTANLTTSTAISTISEATSTITTSTSSSVAEHSAASVHVEQLPATTPITGSRQDMADAVLVHPVDTAQFLIPAVESHTQSSAHVSTVVAQHNAQTASTTDSVTAVVPVESGSHSSSTVSGHAHSTTTRVEDALIANQSESGTLSTATPTHLAEDATAGSGARMDLAAPVDLAVAMPVEIAHSTITGAVERIEQVESVQSMTAGTVDRIEQVETVHNATIGSIVETEQVESAVVRTDLVGPAAVSGVVHSEQVELAASRTDLVVPAAIGGAMHTEQVESAELRTDLIVPAAVAVSALDQVAHSTSASAAAARTDFVSSSSSVVHNSSSTNVFNSSNSNINTSIVNSRHTSSHTHTHIHTHVHTHTHTSSYSSTSSHSSTSTSSATSGHHAHGSISIVDARTDLAPTAVGVASNLAQVSHDGEHSTPTAPAAAAVIMTPAVGSITSEINLITLETTTTANATDLAHEETAVSGAHAVEHGSAPTEVDSIVSGTCASIIAHQAVVVSGTDGIENAGVATELDSATFESSTTNSFTHEAVAVGSADVIHHTGVASELVGSAAPAVFPEPSAPSAPNAAHSINAEEAEQVELPPVAMVSIFEVARLACTTQGHGDTEDQDSASSVVTAASPVLPTSPVITVSPIVAATSPAMEVAHDESVHVELGADARSDLADTVIVHTDTAAVEPTQVAVPAPELLVQLPVQSTTTVFDFSTHATETEAADESVIGSIVETSVVSQVDVSESGSLHSTTEHAATIDNATSADSVSSTVISSETTQGAATTSVVARTDLIAVLDATADAIAQADQAMSAALVAQEPVQSTHGTATSATSRTDQVVSTVGGTTHSAETSTVTHTGHVSSSSFTSSATTFHHSHAKTESFNAVGAAERTDFADSGILASSTTIVHHEHSAAAHGETIGTTESANVVSSSSSSSVTLSSSATSARHEHGAAARFDAAGSAAGLVDHVLVETYADGAMSFHQTDGAPATTGAVGAATHTDVALVQVPSQTAHGSTVIDTAGRTDIVTSTITYSGSTSVSTSHTTIASSERSDSVSITTDDAVLDPGCSDAVTKSQKMLHDNDLQCAPATSAAAVDVAVPTASTTPAIVPVLADVPFAPITQYAPDSTASVAMSPPAGWQPTESAAAESTESTEVLFFVETPASEAAMPQAEAVQSETQVEITEALEQTQIAQDESLVQVNSASPTQIDFIQAPTQTASVQSEVEAVDEQSEELLINTITSTATSVASRLDTMTLAASSAYMLHDESSAPHNLPTAELSDALVAPLSAVERPLPLLATVGLADHAVQSTLNSASESAQAASTTSSSCHSSSTRHSSAHHSSTHHSSTVIHHSTTAVSHSATAGSHSSSTTITSTTRADALTASAITSASTSTIFTTPISAVEFRTPSSDHQLLQPASSFATTVVIDQGILTLPATSAPRLDDTDLNVTHGHGAWHESRSDQVADALYDDIQAEVQLDAAVVMSLVEDAGPDAMQSESTDAPLDEDADLAPLADEVMDVILSETNEAANASLAEEAVIETTLDEALIHVASDTSFSKEIEPDTLFHEPANVEYDGSAETVDLPEEEPHQAAYVSINEVTKTETWAHHAVAAPLGDGAEPESETLFHEVADAVQEGEAGDTSLSDEGGDSDASRGEGVLHEELFTEAADVLLAMDAPVAGDAEAAETLQDESAVLETAFDEVAHALHAEESVDVSQGESDVDASHTEVAEPDRVQVEEAAHDHVDTLLGEDVEHDTSLDQDHDDEAVLDEAVDAPLGQEANLDAVHEEGIEFLHEAHVEAVHDSHVEAVQKLHVEVQETLTSLEESADLTQAQDPELDVASGEAADGAFAEDEDAVVEEEAVEAADTLRIETANLVAPSSEISDSDMAFSQADELVESHETADIHENVESIVFHSDIGKQEALHIEFTMQDALIVEVSDQGVHHEEDAKLATSIDAAVDAFTTPMETEIEPSRADEVAVMQADKPGLTECTNELLCADTAKFPTLDLAPVHVALVPEVDFAEASAAIVDVRPIKGDLSTSGDADFPAPALPLQPAEFDANVPEPALFAADADAASVQSAETDSVTPVALPAAVAMEADAASVQSFGSDGSTPVPEPTLELAVMGEAQSETSMAWLGTSHSSAVAVHHSTTIVSHSTTFVNQSTGRTSHTSSNVGHYSSSTTSASTLAATATPVSVVRLHAPPHSHSAETSAEELVDEPHGQDADLDASLNDVAEHNVVQLDGLPGEAAELESQLDETADASQVENVEPEPLLDEHADVLQGEPHEAAEVSALEMISDETAVTSHNEGSVHGASDASLSEGAEPETLYHAPSNTSHGDSEEVKIEAVNAPKDEPGQTAANFSLKDTSLGEGDANSDALQGEGSAHEELLTEAANELHVMDAPLACDTEAAEALQDESAVLATVFDEVADASQAEEAVDVSQGESDEAVDASRTEIADPYPLQDDDVEHDRADTPLTEKIASGTLVDPDFDDEAPVDEDDLENGQDGDLVAVDEENAEAIDDSRVEAVLETHIEVVETQTTFEETANVTQDEEAEFDAASSEAANAPFVEEHVVGSEEAADASYGEKHDVLLSEIPDVLLVDATDMLHIELAEEVMPSDIVEPVVPPSGIAESDASFSQVDELVELHETIAVHDQSVGLHESTVIHENVESSVFHSDVVKPEVPHNELTQQETLFVEASYQDAHVDEDADLTTPMDTAGDDAFVTPIEADLEPKHGNGASVVQVDKPAVAESINKLLFTDTTEFLASDTASVHVALAPEVDFAGVSAATVDVQPIKGDLSTGDGAENSAPSPPPRLAEFDAYVPEPALVAANTDAASVQSAETDRVTPIPPAAVVAMESDAASVQSFGSDGSTPVFEPALESLVEDEHAAALDTSASAAVGVDLRDHVSTADTDDELVPVTRNDEPVPATSVNLATPVDEANDTFAASFQAEFGASLVDTASVAQASEQPALATASVVDTVRPPSATHSLDDADAVGFDPASPIITATSPALASISHIASALSPVLSAAASPGLTVVPPVVDAAEPDADVSTEMLSDLVLETDAEPELSIEVVLIPPKTELPVDSLALSAGAQTHSVAAANADANLSLVEQATTIVASALSTIVGAITDAQQVISPVLPSEAPTHSAQAATAEFIARADLVEPAAVLVDSALVHSTHGITSETLIPDAEIAHQPQTDVRTDLAAIAASSSTSVQLVQDSAASTSAPADSGLVTVIAPPTDLLEDDVISLVDDLLLDDGVHFAPAAFAAVAAVLIPAAAPLEPDSTVFAAASPPAIRQPVEPVMVEPGDSVLTQVEILSPVDSVQADFERQTDFAQVDTVQAVETLLDPSTPTAAPIADAQSTADVTSSTLNSTGGSVRTTSSTSTSHSSSTTRHSTTIVSHSITTVSHSTTLISHSSSTSSTSTSTSTSSASSSTVDSSASAASTTLISVVGFRAPSPDLQLPQPENSAATAVALESGALALTAEDVRDVHATAVPSQAHDLAQDEGLPVVDVPDTSAVDEDERTPRLEPIEVEVGGADDGSLVSASPIVLADHDARVQDQAPYDANISEPAPATDDIKPVPRPAPLVAVDSAVDSDLWSDHSEKTKLDSHYDKQVSETESETAAAEYTEISSESDAAKSICATPVPTHAAIAIVSNPEEDLFAEQTETAATFSSSVATVPAKVDGPTAPARVSAPDWATMSAGRWMRATVPTFNALSSRPVAPDHGAPAAGEPTSPTAVSAVSSTHFASKDSVDIAATSETVLTRPDAQVVAEDVATMLDPADQIAADPARRGEGWGVGRWMHGKVPAIDVPSLQPVVVSRVTAVTERTETVEFAPASAAHPRPSKDAIFAANDDDTDDEELVPSTEPSLASDLSHSGAEEEEEGDDGSAVPSTRPSMDSLASDAEPASAGDNAALSKRPSLSAISVTSESSESSKLHAGPIQKRGGKRAPKKKRRKHEGHETQVHTTTTMQSTKHSSTVQTVTTTSTTQSVSRRASSSSGSAAISASEHVEHDAPAASPAVTVSDANVADPTSWSVMNTARWMRSQIPKLEVPSLPAIVPVRRTSVPDLAPPTTASLESMFFTGSTKDAAGSAHGSNATSLVVTDDDDMTENDELAPSTAPSLASELIHSDSDGEEEEEEEDDHETTHLSARPSMDSLAFDATSTEAAAPATLSKRPSLSAISITSSSGGSIKLHAVPTQKRGGKRAPKKKHRKHDGHEPQAIAASTQHPPSTWPITSVASTRSRRASSSSLTGSLGSERVDTHQAMTTTVALDTNAVHSADQSSSSVGRWMRSRVTSFSSIGSHRDAPVSGPTSPAAASVLSDQDGVAASIASASSPDAVVTASNVGLWSFLSKLAQVKPANVDVVGTDLSKTADRVAVEDATADRLTPVPDVEEEEPTVAAEEELAIVADDEPAVVAEGYLTVAVEEPTADEEPAVEEKPVAEEDMIVDEEAIVGKTSTVEKEAVVKEEEIVEEELTVAAEMEPVVLANDESAITAAADELTPATEDAPAAKTEQATTVELDATDGTNAADSTAWSVLNAGKWMRAQLPKMDVPSLPGRRSSITELMAPSTWSDSTSIRSLKHMSSLRSSTTTSRVTTDDDLTDDDELMPSAAPSLIHSEIEEDEDDHDHDSLRLSARPSMDSLASDTPAPAPAPATLSKRPSVSAISATSSSSGSAKLLHAPTQKRGGKRAPAKGKKAKAVRKQTTS